MKYSFKTEYVINAEPELIWNILSDVESWPGLLKYFRSVRFRGNEKILKQNAVIDCEVRAVLPYTLRFNTEIIRLVPYKELEVISRGDLKGKGLWTLTSAGNGSLSSFTWEVEPGNKIMRVIGSFKTGRLILSYSHGLIMKRGYRSLLAIIKKNKISQAI